MMLGLKIQYSSTHVAMENLIMQDYGIGGFAGHQL
jgi:phenylpyruvate tautomerase PptA (4-oxalocrotonate tautomerase family)